jgi:hypothetical protein
MTGKHGRWWEARCFCILEGVEMEVHCGRTWEQVLIAIAARIHRWGALGFFALVFLNL